MLICQLATSAKRNLDYKIAEKKKMADSQTDWPEIITLFSKCGDVIENKNVLKNEQTLKRNPKRI